MNRQQMVEKAAQAIFAQDHLTSDLTSCREDAKAALGAILPQVSTVAELEALPNGAVVLEDECGIAYEKTFTRNPWACGGSRFRSDQIELPATVVWQPEVTA